MYSKGEGCEVDHEKAFKLFMVRYLSNGGQISMIISHKLTNWRRMQADKARKELSTTCQYVSRKVLTF